MRMTFRVPWPSTGLPRAAERLEPRREMPQLRRLLDDPVARQILGAGGDVRHDLDHVVDVALRVGASRDREPDQVRRGRLLRPSGFTRTSPSRSRSPGSPSLVQRHRE